MKKKKDSDLPLRKTMCSTCPFRPNSPYAYLAPELAFSAITECSRICHSTGSSNLINKRTGIEPHFCRGARDIQLNMMYSLGVITRPTDDAWNVAREKIGKKPTIIIDP